MEDELSTKAEVFETGEKDVFGVAYKGNRLLSCRNNKLTAYTVADGTEIICDRAFYDCKARSATPTRSPDSLSSSQ